VEEVINKEIKTEAERAEGLEAYIWTLHIFLVVDCGSFSYKPNP
jgi:hypothetical protein